ncbi:MAG TPA: PQQ-binding-like beta-propeller repeat protein [Prolixibacteraceae bacterium]|nr:PQQ-binding-like beta-propeller repeat protein [Prolixibacteraceae bacterium]HPS13747.1 PQQ-binding-like beta-propeller repeat protein [Prolixibacteraceae bacterium]
MKNLLTTILLFTAFAAQSQPVAQFRGVNRDGIYPGSDLLDEWPAEGPQLLWSTDTIGNGYGSPVISGDILYVNGETDSTSQLFAFSLQGKILWKSPNGPEFTGEGFSAGFPGSRSTPTVYNGLVYVHSGLGRIACVDAQTGKEVWSKHMTKDFGATCGYFGYSESLLADSNYVYCYPGGKDTNVVCLDRFNGNMVWISKALSQETAFCSPMMISLPERKLLITVSKDNLFALDAASGELLWSVHEDSVKMSDECCNTPIFSDGCIYSVPGNEKGKGAMKLKLSPDGKSVVEVWRNGDAKNFFNGFVVTNGKLYATSRSKKLWCVNTNTGAVTDTLKNLSGSLIVADDKLFCYTDNGNMNLIDISGSQMRPISKFVVSEGSKEHIAYPMIHGGVLYIRHGKSLMAYQISK